MTIEEKRAAMREKCRTVYEPYCTSGGGCPLFRDLPAGQCHLRYDNVVERYYEEMCGEKTDEPAPEKETVNHPAHYQGKHECIDEMIALFGVEAVKHFCMCNVYKYRFRAANKNGQEDLDKADWYMDKLMELEGNHD